MKKYFYFTFISSAIITVSVYAAAPDKSNERPKPGTVSLLRDRFEPRANGAAAVGVSAIRPPAVVQQGATMLTIASSKTKPSPKVPSETPHQLIHRLFAPGNSITVMMPCWNEMVLTFSKKRHATSQDDHLEFHMRQASAREAQAFKIARQGNYCVPLPILRDALCRWGLLDDLVSIVQSYMAYERDIKNAIPFAIIPNLHINGPLELRKTYPILDGASGDHFEFQANHAGSHLTLIQQGHSPRRLYHNEGFQAVNDRYDLRIFHAGFSLPTMTSQGLVHASWNHVKRWTLSGEEHVIYSNGRMNYSPFHLNDEIVCVGAATPVNEEHIFVDSTVHPLKMHPCLLGGRTALRVDHLVFGSSDVGSIDVFTVHELTAKSRALITGTQIPSPTTPRPFEFMKSALSTLPMVRPWNGGEVVLGYKNGGTSCLFDGTDDDGITEHTDTQIFFTDPRDNTAYLLNCHIRRQSDLTTNRRDFAILYRLVYE